MAWLLKQAPLLTVSTMEESDSEEEVSRWLKHRQTLKSGKARTADSRVVKHITLPHELIFTSRGQCAMCKQLSVPLFILGYIAILDTVKSMLKEIMFNYLRELMADAATYGWEPIQTYHVVWLQQLENRHAEWEDADIKLEFHRPWSGTQCSKEISGLSPLLLPAGWLQRT